MQAFICCFALSPHIDGTVTHFLAQMFAILPSQMFHAELADLTQEIGDDSSQVKRRGTPEAGEGPTAP